MAFTFFRVHWIGSGLVDTSCLYEKAGSFLAPREVILLTQWKSKGRWASEVICRVEDVPTWRM